jgi:toxin-antitoxin system PIN domain toxin
MMDLFDVNILVNSSNIDSSDHASCFGWLEATTNGAANFGVADLVLSGFIRIATNRKIFPRPLSTEEAVSVVEGIRSRPNCAVIHPGPRHWGIFIDLCQKVGARSNLVPDAYLAALAIESGCEWVSADRDYARFPGLRWRHPLDG